MSTKAKILIGLTGLLLVDAWLFPRLRVAWLVIQTITGWGE